MTIRAGSHRRPQKRLLAVAVIAAAAVIMYRFVVPKVVAWYTHPNKLQDVSVITPLLAGRDREHGVLLALEACLDRNFDVANVANWLRSPAPKPPGSSCRRTLTCGFV